MHKESVLNVCTIHVCVRIECLGQIQQQQSLRGQEPNICVLCVVLEVCLIVQVLMQSTRSESVALYFVDNYQVIIGKSKLGNLRDACQDYLPVVESPGIFTK
eukprot:TRINITY_DN6953_c0_g3_i1.p4 TRINITY_DN6953_c0_g3~~TRINITY_DN6953_c0_g3_i1.p4  ORF type:complete len:102 (+),score=5.82 TRINITY_DN6953_c0_g3_i1:269-574(+)